MVGRELSLFAVVIPFWLVVAQVGWRGMIEVWPACLVTGLSFGLTEFLVSNYHGPWLAGIASAIVSMASLVLLMMFWQPANEQPAGVRETSPDPAPAHQDAPAWKAWLPWIFLTVFVFLWGLPAVKKFLDNIFSKSFPMPGLHNLVQRVPPVVALPAKEPAPLSAFAALSFPPPAPPCSSPDSSPAFASGSTQNNCCKFMGARSGVSAFPCSPSR